MRKDCSYTLLPGLTIRALFPWLLVVTSLKIYRINIRIKLVNWFSTSFMVTEIKKTERTFSCNKLQSCCYYGGLWESNFVLGLASTK